MAVFSFFRMAVPLIPQKSKPIMAVSNADCEIKGIEYIWLIGTLHFSIICDLSNGKDI